MSGETYEPVDREHDALAVAEAMLDAIAVYEQLSGDRFDPAHPNARPELRRVAATRGFGAAGFRYLWKPYQKLIDQLITGLLSLTAARAAS